MEIFSYCDRCVVYRYRHHMDELKEAFQSTTDYKRKLGILTLSPFGRDETAKFFGASSYLTSKSRQLKKTHGILPQTLSASSRGRRITIEEQDKIKQFYESDAVSRICPGQKDYVVVRDSDGTKSKVQKRLVLGTLREIYALYKKDESNPQIGFSRFASLRPKNCVLAGSAGTHAVCVCTYHQNPKLVLSALGFGDLSYRDLLDHAVCDTDNRDCMMGACAACPGEEGVLAFLQLLSQGEDADEDTDDDVEEVRYKQWVSTDRCTLKEIVESREDCLKTLSQQIADLTLHHYRAKAQSAYFAQLKERVGEGEVVVQGDFAENFSFVVQDAAQGFHWDSSQCTVHPFVVYWREEGVSCHESFCCISDGTKHNTAMVYTFQQRLIPEIRKKVPTLKKVYYFSDGCAAQYKNKYNFVNVCAHDSDFDGVTCEWNFFATSHGKGACDGVGGVVKRATYQESLKRPKNDQILTAGDMFAFLTEKFVSIIKFMYISKSDVAEETAFLTSRFANAVTVKGTKRFHKFTPVSSTTALAHELSVDQGKQVKVSR